MKRSHVVFAAGLLALVIVSGCNKKDAPAPAPASQMQPGEPAVMSPSGKVVETMNSGGYTYVCLEKGGTKTWVALPAMAAKVGQEIKCQPGIEMKDFTSKTLNRTFASIVFSGGVL